MMQERKRNTDGPRPSVHDWCIRKQAKNWEAARIASLKLVKKDRGKDRSRKTSLGHYSNPTERQWESALDEISGGAEASFQCLWSEKLEELVSMVISLRSSFSNPGGGKVDYNSNQELTFGCLINIKLSKEGKHKSGVQGRGMC